MGTLRAMAFSGKKKKQQLQEKRSKKRGEEVVPIVIEKPKTQRGRENKLLSKWEPKGSRGGVHIPCLENPLYSQKAVEMQDTGLRTIDVSTFYEQTSIDIPLRPDWSSSMSKEELDSNEESNFKSWLEYVYAKCGESNMGYFEHNLEVWRQFWRVCEISDIIVAVVDARFPILHFPLSLFRYLREVLKKPFVLAMMKSDFLEDSLLESWKNSIQGFFNHDFPIIDLSVYQLDSEVITTKSQRRKRYTHASGVNSLLQNCYKLSGERYSNEWQQICKDIKPSSMGVDNTKSADDDYITIGMLGHPNVGKSSLINSIVGKKVVSASRTPGHTKHFQTIHLSKHIRLCDCPGLIFPVALSRDVQILNGLYNVAQVRDPFGPLLIACTMVNLPDLLEIQLGEEDLPYWTMLAICEKFAIKRGFYTSKAGRPDLQRSANFLLRMILDGRILIAWKPKAYQGTVARLLSVTGSEGSSTSEVRSESSSSEQNASLNSNPFDLLCEES